MRRVTPLSEWRWFGQAGHLCVAERCRFHLCTKVGKYLVSTIGEFFAKNEDEKPTEIGCNRLFETMVFKAGKPCNAEVCGKCGMPEIDGRELDFTGYKKIGDAARGHVTMCHKWAKKP